MAAFDKLREVTGWGYDSITHAFDIQQTRKTGQFPIVCVLPFESVRSDAVGLPCGSGIGRLLASLLRRDLILSKCLSVLGIEDTPPMPLSAYLDSERSSDGQPQADYTIGARLAIESSTIQLEVAVVSMTRHSNPPDTFLVRSDHEDVARLSQDLSSKCYQALRVDASQDTRALWEIGRPGSWDHFRTCGECWKQEDGRRLVELLEAGSAHPDALVILSDDSGDADLARRGLSQACDQDPYNPQLLFNFFCVTWKGTGPDAAGARLLRQALTYGPGRRSFELTPLLCDALQRFCDGAGATDAGTTEQYVIGRVLGAILNEAGLAQSDGVAAPEDIDTAMKLGAKYPAGPLAWAERIGYRTVRGLLVRLNEGAEDGRFEPAGLYL